MGKVYTRFQAKTAQKPHPFGTEHTYKASIREYPPGGGVDHQRIAVSVQFPMPKTNFIESAIHRNAF